MRTLEEMRARQRQIVEELRALNDQIGTEAPTEDQQTRWDTLDAEETQLRSDIAQAEAEEARAREVAAEAEKRAARVAESRAKWGSVGFDSKPDPFAVLAQGRGANRQALIDANLRALDGRIDDGANQSHTERLIKRHSSDTDWARNLLGRSRPEYESGFAKMMTGNEVLLTPEERAAVAVGTNTQGGLLVPTHLDPTLILTNSGTNNAIRGISRVVTLTQGNVWHGATTAGVTASFDAELAEVSDDSPTFVAPSVSLHMARGFVQASIEAFEDIDNLATDVLMLFADARDRLEAAKHAVGSGTAEPWGIFAALDANTNVEIISTTAATIGEVDIHSVYRQVPIRWRNRASWVMNPLYSLAVKRLGTAVSSSYSGDLTMPVTDRILGRPLVETDDAPTTQTTTANDNEIVFGDFSNFVIVDKPGSMSIEFIPHMVHTSNNLPNFVRGWVAFWRNGSDSVNDVGFRLLQDKTSA